jgi:hypothetical protein
MSRSALRLQLGQIKLNELRGTSQIVTGTSTLFKGKSEDGTTLLTWVKEKPEYKNTLQALQSAVDNIIDRIPKRTTLDDFAFKDQANNLLTMYCFTDLHCGLKTWHKEVGRDFDLKIFRKTYTAAINLAISAAPQSQKAILLLNGDLFHFDGEKPVTPRSQHVLDVDSRYSRMFDTGFEVFSHMIDCLLQKHNEVEVICRSGNHDLISGQLVGKMLKVLYRNEPRLTITSTDYPVSCTVFGSNAIFSTHGHIVSYQKLVDWIKSRFKKEFGASEFTYGYTGHLHTFKAEDRGGIIITQLPTLTPSDSHGIGFEKSASYLRVDVFDHDYGRINEIAISEKLVDSFIKNNNL